MPSIKKRILRAFFVCWHHGGTFTNLCGQQLIDLPHFKESSKLLPFCLQFCLPIWATVLKKKHILWTTFDILECFKSRSSQFHKCKCDDENLRRKVGKYFGRCQLGGSRQQLGFLPPPTLREDIRWEKMSKLWYCKLCTGLENSPHRLCRKKFDVFSNMCLLLPLFIPLIHWQTQTSYTRYRLLFPPFNKDPPQTSFQRKTQTSTKNTHIFHILSPLL